MKKGIIKNNLRGFTVISSTVGRMKGEITVKFDKKNMRLKTLWKTLRMKHFLFQKPLFRFYRSVPLGTFKEAKIVASYAKRHWKSPFIKVIYIRIRSLRCKLLIRKIHPFGICPIDLSTLKCPFGCEFCIGSMVATLKI